MSYSFGAVILLLFCFIISKYEYSKFGTVITPFGVMAWPYTIIVLIINLVGRHFGFFPVSLKCIFIIIVGMLFFILGGHGANRLFHNAKSSYFLKANNSKTIEEILNSFYPFFVGLAFISIAAGLIHFYLTISEIGWDKIALRGFEEEYGSGPLAHVMLIGRASFIFLFADYIKKKRKLSLFLLGFLFIIVLVRQVKYHLFVMILGGLYFSYFHNLLKLGVRKYVLYLLGTYFLFNVAYVVGFSVLGIDNVYSQKVQGFLFNHFFTYLFGGPIGFSAILEDPSFPLHSSKEIFSVPINLYRFLHGDSHLVDIIFHRWVSVSTIHKYFHSTNVFSLFGMLYAYLGTIGSFIYLFFLGFFSYTLGIMAKKRKENLGFQMMYVYLLSFLTLSFFGFYFNILSFWEVSVMMIIIPVIFSIGKSLSKKLIRE